MASVRARIIAAAIALFGAGGTGASVYWLQASGEVSSPLSGKLHHEFGEVRKTSQIVRLQHEFVLKNVSTDVIEIVKVTSSCGCTAAQPSAMLVRPGESTVVTATLSVQSAKRRQETVWLVLDGHGVLPLTLAATVRRLHSIQSSRKEVLISENAEATFVLIALDYVTNIPPVDPLLTAPKGIEAEFAGWLPVLSVDERTGRPARWQGVVTIRRTGEELHVGTYVSANVGEEDAVRIAVREATHPGPALVLLESK